MLGGDLASFRVQAARSDAITAEWLFRLRVLSFVRAPAGPAMVSSSSSDKFFRWIEQVPATLQITLRVTYLWRARRIYHRTYDHLLQLARALHANNRRCVYRPKLSALTAAEQPARFQLLFILSQRFRSPLSLTVLRFVFDFLAASSYVSGSITTASAAENNIIREIKIIYPQHERERERERSRNRYKNDSKPQVVLGRQRSRLSSLLREFESHSEAWAKGECMSRVAG